MRQTIIALATFGMALGSWVQTAPARERFGPSAVICCQPGNNAACKVGSGTSCVKAGASICMPAQGAPCFMIGSVTGCETPLVSACLAPSAGMSTLSRILCGAASAMAYAGVTPDEEGSYAWLGVVLSPAPEPLVRHLSLDGQGIMVMNVAAGSPADQAGLEQFDVIVELAGEPVSNEFAEFGEQVRGFDPGDSVVLKVIRGGEPLNVKVIMGDRPTESGELAYVYESQPRRVFNQKIKGLGKIIHKDDEGNWVVQELGEIGDFAPLVLDLPQLGGLGRSIKVLGDDASSTIRIKTIDDEGSLEVVYERDGDEPNITVRRTREVNGVEQTEETHFTSEDELREADPDAYEQIKGIHSGARAFSFRFDMPDLDELPMLQKEWSTEIEHALKQNQHVWRDTYNKAMEAYEQAMPQFQDALRQSDDARKLLQDLRKDGMFAWQGHMMSTGKARISISEEPNGRITVTTRKGDAELIRVYQDEDELSERDPRAWRKYQSLQEADVE